MNLFKPYNYKYKIADNDMRNLLNHSSIELENR